MSPPCVWDRVLGQRDLTFPRADHRASVNSTSGPIGEIQDFSYVQFRHCGDSLSVVSLCFGFYAQPDSSTGDLRSTVLNLADPSSHDWSDELPRDLSPGRSSHDRSDKLPRDLGSLDFPTFTFRFWPDFTPSDSPSSVSPVAILRLSIFQLCNPPDL